MKRHKNGKELPCETCGVIFYVTPTRLRNNKHHTCSKACGSQLLSKMTSKKIKTPCVICSKEIEYKPSHYRKIKNHTCTSECRAELNKQIYKGKGNPNSLGLSEFERIFWDRAKSYQNRSTTKGIECNIDYKFLIDLYNKQEGKCYYTELPLRLEQPKSFDTMSLDRLDSTKGYIKDNVVFCLNCVNMFKSSYTLEELKPVFSAIELKNAYNINTKIKKLYEDSIAPSKKDINDAAYDVYVHRIEEEDNYIKIYTGISIEPQLGYYYMLVPRSSTYKKGLTLYNNCGIIDQNFRGEIMAIFLKTPDFKELPKIGDRVAQLVPQKQINVEFEEVSELTDTERGSGGFGHTGR